MIINELEFAEFNKKKENNNKEIIVVKEAKDSDKGTIVYIEGKKYILNKTKDKYEI